jgi:hypothetical protein
MMSHCLSMPSLVFLVLGLLTKCSVEALFPNNLHLSASHVHYVIFWAFVTSSSSQLGVTATLLEPSLLGAFIHSFRRSDALTVAPERLLTFSNAGLRQNDRHTSQRRAHRSWSTVNSERGLPGVACRGYTAITMRLSTKALKPRSHKIHSPPPVF